jgi:DNA-directed RNA polymerase specialized sigma subunit
MYGVNRYKHVDYKLSVMHETIKQLSTHKKRNPTDEEIMESMGITVDILNFLKLMEMVDNITSSAYDLDESE